MVVYTQVREYVLAKVGGVGGIRSDADEMTQTLRTEESLVYLSEDLMSTAECFAWVLIKTIFLTKRRFNNLLRNGVPSRLKHSEAHDAIKTSACHGQVPGFHESVLSYGHAFHHSI